MLMRRRAFLSLSAALLAVRPAATQDHQATEQYSPSDPALVGNTGGRSSWSSTTTLEGAVER
jgi:hypothetical protein